MTQTIGQQPQARRERAEIATIRSVNAPAHRVPSCHNLQRDDPRIGQRRRNQQARKERRIAEATPVDPNAAPLLVRERGLDRGAAAIQRWRMLQINMRRHQIDGALVGRVPDRQCVDRAVLGRRHPGLLDRHDRPALGARSRIAMALSPIVSRISLAVRPTSCRPRAVIAACPSVLSYAPSPRMVTAASAGTNRASRSSSAHCRSCGRWPVRPSAAAQVIGSARR